MKILISGSSGLVGSALVSHFREKGNEPIRLIRSIPKAGENSVYWNPEVDEIERERLEGLDVVIHLAGENIAAGRWTQEQKQRIRDSRVEGTRFLSEELAGLRKPPQAFFSASAIGIYGDRGDEILTEESPLGGEGFLTEVVKEWEAAAEPLVKKGIRVLHLRFGLILSRSGGALAKMLFPFRMGLGGVLGKGNQWMSWISIEDVVGAVDFLLDRKDVGAFNLTAPQPVTNRIFTKTLGKVLRRPTFMSVPETVLRLALGEMARELLSSVRVEPKRLQEVGYRFQYQELEAALRAILL
jgi:hypothetical protein